MNGSDYFTIKILVAEYGGSFQVDARIAGVKQVRTNRRQARLYASWLLPALIGLSITLMALYIPFKERVEARVSSPPIIEHIRVSPPAVPVGGTTILTAFVIAPLGEKLEYRWAASPGEIDGTGYDYRPSGRDGPVASFKAPTVPGLCKVLFEVMDKFGRTARADVNILVVSAPVPPERQKNKP